MKTTISFVVALAALFSVSVFAHPFVSTEYGDTYIQFAEQPNNAVRVRYSTHIMIPGLIPGQFQNSGQNGDQIGGLKTQSKVIPNMVVVERLASYWIHSPRNNSRVRITVPVRFYMTSWDVNALERELQRLGVKLKPKPTPPKPSPPGFVVAGIIYARCNRERTANLRHRKLPCIKSSLLLSLCLWVFCCGGVCCQRKCVKVIPKSV